MGNTFGHLFRVTTFGESHGPAVGAVIDGCPPLLELAEADLQAELDRRRPGQSALTTQRREADQAEILSGVFEGRTLGTPIAVLVRNTDAKPQDYEDVRRAYRPSHADYTYQAQVRRPQLEGRRDAPAPARPIGRVAAGAIAQKLLRERCATEVLSYVARVQSIEAAVDHERLDRAAIEATPTRCPDPAAAERMVERIGAARKDGDSLGGVVQTLVRGVPPGLGEPVFDKLEAELGRALLSLPACKGFEIGSGFGGTLLTGSTHNDPFYAEDGRVRTRTNHSGGVQGGITNGEDIVVRAAFKPTATILREQETVDVDGNPTTIKGRGRHDPCVLPRAVPLVDAMVALVLADHYLLHGATSAAVLQFAKETET